MNKQFFLLLILLLILSSAFHSIAVISIMIVLFHSSGIQRDANVVNGENAGEHAEHAE